MCGEKGVVCMVWWEREGKGPLERLRGRWEDNIVMGRQEVGCGVMGCIERDQDRDRWRAVVNAVMKLRVALNVWVTLL